MIREEAIEYNKNLREYMRITDKKSEYKFLKENYEALDMAIQALKQEPILDKIRAEISKAWYTHPQSRYEEGLKDQALRDMKIIDRFKAESEE